MDFPSQGKYKSEGDVNLSYRRKKWQEKNIGAIARALLEEDEKYFFKQSLSTPCLNVIESCSGATFTDTDGREYLDFHGNYVHNLGFAHPLIVDRIKTQLDELSFCVRRYTNKNAIALAKKIAEKTPEGLSKSLFAPGGTIAVETSLKLARGYTGRFKTLSFWDSFHGATLGSISVGGEDIFRRNAGPLLVGTEHVAPPNCYRCPYGFSDSSCCDIQCARYVEYVLEKEGDFCAIISETIRSTPYIPPDQYWKIIKKACDRFGTLLIFDEIPTALGRTGKWFAFEHYDVIPDILVIGKPLGGGILPLAAMVANEKFDVLGEHAIGHYTHEKNPVLCAAALATFEVIENEGIVERAEKMGRYLLSELLEMQKIHQLIGDVRGKGLLIGLELVTDRETKKRAVDEAEEIMYEALSMGLSFKLTMGNIITLNPSLLISQQEINRALEIIDHSLTMVEKRM